MQQMSYCPRCGNPVPAAVSGPVVCQTCGTVIQPPSAQPFMPPASLATPGDYPTTVTNPYATPASSLTPPAMPAANVPPSGSDYPYPNMPAQQPMTPPMAPPAPGGYPPPSYSGQPMPGAPAPYPYPYAGPPQPPQRRSNPILIVAIAALVVVLVAAGVAFALSQQPNNPIGGTNPTATIAATATTAPTATSSSSSNLTTFTDPNNFYTVGVPSGWAQDNRSSGGTSEELFQDPDSGAVAEFLYLSGQQDPATSDNQFLSGVGNISNKQGPTSVNHAGEMWAEETGDTTISGQSEHVDVLATNHGGNVVVAAFLAPVNSFDKISSDDFVPMFASFQFSS